MSEPSRPSVAAAGDRRAPPGASAAFGQPLEAGALASEPADGRKTILICDDEPSLRELVRAILGSGYRYAEAVDGSQALELTRSLVPDLVVLDLMLPQTSGFEVLDAIRSDPAARRTRVIVLTAWSHVEAAVRAAGADRFVSKPFEPDELEAHVQELLS